MDKNKKPKQSTTVFLIISTMLLSLALFACGIYSLYISIGFRFLNRSAVVGLNTATLYTYPNSSYGTGSGTMVGLILISIIMIGLGIGMAIIFFKQLPLYKQIRFIAKMPNVKYKEYSQQAKKSVIVWSIIAYIIAIAFSIFALIVVYRSGVSANYLWIIAATYFVVLGLSIASMVLMFVKIAQLSKIRRTLKDNEHKENIKKQLEQKYILVKPEEKGENQEPEKATTQTNIKIQQPEPVQLETQPAESATIAPPVGQNIEVQPVSSQLPNNGATAPVVQPAPVVIEEPKNIAERLFTDGIFELGDQLVKLREIHVSGLISNDEYTMLREKWIDAVLSEPLFGKKRASKVKTKKVVPAKVRASDNDSEKIEIITDFKNDNQNKTTD